MKKEIVVFLLIISLITNVYMWKVYEHPEQKQVDILQEHVIDLQTQNDKLNQTIIQNNVSLNSYASQLDYYKEQLLLMQTNNSSNITLMENPFIHSTSAHMLAPAVYQAVEYIDDGFFTRQYVTEHGSVMDVTVEIDPGKGRVLVQTKPLMGTVFQDAANTAVFVAQNITGKNLMNSDIIFSITSEDEIPGVDGPSAGALMTLLTISAVNDQKIDDGLILTGTIDQNGNIGAIGGEVHKAQASKDAGKTLFLLPRENSRMIQYTYVERNIGGLVIQQQRPEIFDAKTYIEENVGIRVEYVDNIQDVMKYAFEN